MRVLRACKMISLATYGGKSWMLFGFLWLASCLPPVWTRDYLSLNVSSFKLNSTDRLVSSPNPYFELGIFQLNNSGIATAYFFCIRYAFPIEQKVTWMANRSSKPLTSSAVLRFNNGTLELSDGNDDNQRDNIWSTFTNNMDIVSVQLNDTGNLLLRNKNGTIVWNSFIDSSPTDTLLPGLSMNRSQGHNLTSFQKNGNPQIASDTYSFGWNAKRVLTLSWICPKAFLNWKGGSYIPAPDVYAAHTIQNVDNVYFHKTLGHLYIDSKPVPTAILSGGPDPVNATTLKRITMSSDGGLRILQYTINQPWNETLQMNERRRVVANWVVSDRPDSRNQCTTYGTCGQFSQCISPFDSLEPVTCQCPGTDNITTKDWFTPIDEKDLAKGCNYPTVQAGCLANGTYDGTIDSVGMLELPGVDMPWGGDYQNLTGDDPAKCVEACALNCYCAGVVFSKDERMCWQENAVLYNIGYPTVALHGTDRTSYLRNQKVPDYPKPQVAKKDNKLVKILVPTIGILGVLLVVMVTFCLWWSFRRPPQNGIGEFPGPDD